MEAVRSYCIHDPWQHVVIVVARHGVGVDSRLGQLGDSRFEWAGGFKKTIGMVDHVATECDQVYLLSDRQLDDGRPHAGARALRANGIGYPCRGPTDVQVCSRENFDRHAKTGKQCLQLTGGPHASVTLVVANTVDTTGELTFQAERWTKRAPFSFRIEKNSRSGWQEIYNGDRNVRVGRAFLTHVKVPLGDAEIQQLRFTVTSPPDTGILIDDVRIAPVRPQKIVSVEVVPFTLPALVGVGAGERPRPRYLV